MLSMSGLSIKIMEAPPSCLKQNISGIASWRRIELGHCQSNLIGPNLNISIDFAASLRLTVTDKSY